MATTQELAVAEFLPSIGSYVDDEGDIRPIDDDPSGFGAVGTTPKYSDYFRGDAIEGDNYDYDSTDVHGPSVQLGQRAVNLLEAVDLFSSASQLQGIIDSKDMTKIARYGGEFQLKRKIALQLGLGTKALRSAEGLDTMLLGTFKDKDEPYDEQQASDDVVLERRLFLDSYTGYGVRRMSGVSAAEKQAEKKSIDSARDNLRTTLNSQRL